MGSNGSEWTNSAATIHKIVMNIRSLQRNELIRVQEIAQATWPATFKDILSKEQIDYMLNWMYSLETLEAQFDNGHVFFVAERDHEQVGFIGIETDFPQVSVTKIHKIYILPNQQGQGIGKRLITHVSEYVQQRNQTALQLNVNRYNKASEFYKKLGFELLYEENIDIGNGFWMEDFVMKLLLN